MSKKKREDRHQGKKKDTGIAIVDAKMSTGQIVSFKIDEAKRDFLNKLRGRPREPSFNPDTATTKELEEIQFSGFRLNKLTNQLELWCYGKILSRRNAQQATANPGIIADMHEEAFQTVGSIISIDTPEKPSQEKQNDKKS